MEIEHYKPAFFILLIIFAGWIYADYSKDAVTKAKVLRLAGQAERFNSENWRHVVPAVKEAATELRLHLGIDVPLDSVAKLKAEATEKAKEEIKDQEAQHAREQRERREMVKQVTGAIQLAVAPLPKQFEIAKADPLSVNAEYAQMIEEKVYELYPNCTLSQCASICVSARSYLAARGTGLARDVVSDLLEGYHSEDDCPARNQDVPETDERE